MPTYDYHCSQCGHSMEAFQKITEEALKLCPECGHETLKRGPGGGVGLSFKGTGYYITDYARKENPGLKVDTGPPGETPKPPACPCNKNKCCK